MDKRVSEALAFANYKLTLQVQRQNIDARVATAMLVSSQGAIFKTTQELISFVELHVRLGLELFVEDHSGNVIKIENTQEFLTLLTDAYMSAMQFKHAEQQKLKAARSTAKIVGL
jgi:hypothetical protein